MDLAEALQVHIEKLYAFDSVDVDEVKGGDQILGTKNVLHGAHQLVRGLMVNVGAIENGVVTAGSYECLLYDPDTGPCEESRTARIVPESKEFDLTDIEQTYDLYLMPTGAPTANRWESFHAPADMHLPG